VVILLWRWSCEEVVVTVDEELPCDHPWEIAFWCNSASLLKIDLIRRLIDHINKVT
jgi:hypothetical protein